MLKARFVHRENFQSLPPDAHDHPDAVSNLLRRLKGLRMFPSKGEEQT